jgi:regulator of nucleoside diphosphate kinase
VEIDRLQRLIGRQPRLRQRLARATVVPPAEVPPDVVTMNSQVVYQDCGSGVRESVRLVYPQLADGRRRISVTSSLGTSLLGTRIGQELSWQSPASGRRRLRVEAILSQPESERPGPSLDAKLDEALRQTFPASDPFWIG